MRRLVLGLTFVLVAGSLAACSSSAPGPRGTASPATAPTDPSARYRVTLAPSTLSPEQQVVHVLYRLGYGPRPPFGASAEPGLAGWRASARPGCSA